MGYLVQGLKHGMQDIGAKSVEELSTSSMRASSGSSCAARRHSAREACTDSTVLSGSSSLPKPASPRASPPAASEMFSEWELAQPPSFFFLRPRRLLPTRPICAGHAPFESPGEQAVSQ